MGGEKLMPPRMGFWFKGSPPHGRGKVEDMKKAGLNPRITPAWAGKSQADCAGHGARGDHPRMGGEKKASAPAVC